MDHFPHDSIVDLSVGVDENIPEGDDPLIVLELSGKIRVDFGELRQRLSDDGKRTFDCEAQHWFLLVVSEIFAARKADDKFSSVPNVEEVLLDFKPHKERSGCVERSRENRDF